MTIYEITYHCADDDWLSFRVKCADFHEAVTTACSRLLMHQATTDKLHGARLLRIQRVIEIE